MGLYTQLPDAVKDVDVIIAGGGTAGCIVAARLSDAQPNLSVLVIEGGQNNYNVPNIVYPALCLSNILPTSKTALFYTASKETKLADREIVVPSGGTLGGGSSVNLMMYTRAQRQDFDSWQTPGWSAEEILPYLKKVSLYGSAKDLLKLETYYGPGAKETHGFNGPVQVSGGTYRARRAEEDFIKAAGKVGLPEVEDAQNLNTSHGVQRAVRYISPDGKRQDVAHGYLHPRLQDHNHPNLHVLVEAQVVRVLFDGKRAAGVEYKPNPDFQSSTAVRSIKARKMVIVSCGALGTPPVLERSGVGDSEILQRAGIQIVANVSGVGRNYQDHHLLVYPYKSSLGPEETADSIFDGRLDLEALIRNNDKVLGWNVQDVTCRLRPTDTEVATLGSAFQAAWDREFKPHRNKPIALMAPVNVFPGEPGSVPVGQYYSISVFTVYPFSRGHIHITGPDVGDRLEFKTGYFSDPHDIDIKKHTWMYKKQREVIRRMDTYRGEVAAAHPPFPPSSKAACIELDNGPLTNMQDIEYTAEDDAILEQWLRENVGTTWHSLGTCKMAPREEMGVVDANLGVYGVGGLKIADLSIPPGNVAANTANTAMAIGEKAADIFIRELGLDRE
ncbi:MAG: hypothetical protein Q9160_008051 [Pyrenula sp. 1 TL-2023]